MKKSIKPVLLSALVFPGAGHFFLKKYLVGSILLCLFLVPVYLIFSEVMSVTDTVIAQIQTGEISLDVAVISELITRTVNYQALNIETNSLIIVWIIGVIDSYRLSRSEPK